MSCLFLGSGSHVGSADRFSGEPGALRATGFSCLNPSCGLGEDALGSRDPSARLLLGEASIFCLLLLRTGGVGVSSRCVVKECESFC